MSIVMSPIPPLGVIWPLPGLMSILAPPLSLGVIQPPPGGGDVHFGKPPLLGPPPGEGRRQFRPPTPSGCHWAPAQGGHIPLDRLPKSASAKPIISSSIIGNPNQKKKRMLLLQTFLIVVVPAASVLCCCRHCVL